MTAQAVPKISQWPDASRTQLNHAPSSRVFEARIVDPTCDPEWDGLVASHPGSSFFHSAAWTKVLCKTYGHKPYSLLLSRNGEPAALVPLLEVSSRLTGRRGVCLPFTDFCEPLFFGGCDSSIVSRPLCELARSRNWKYFDIRGGSTSTHRAAASMTFYGHTLDLRNGPEALFAGFACPVRRAIRKAQRSYLNVQLSHSQDRIREFYRIHVRTRRRHGLPPQSLSFFLKIYDEVIKPGFGFVVLASVESRPVAGAVIFHMGKKAVLKFAASDERHHHLRGNNLVMWKSIQFLAQNSFETLHLGRTSREHQGLRRFKLAWGTEEETIECLRFDTRANEWITARDKASGVHNTVFAKLPLVVNRLMGAMIYPHLD